MPSLPNLILPNEIQGLLRFPPDTPLHTLFTPATLQLFRQINPAAVDQYPGGVSIHHLSASQDGSPVSLDLQGWRLLTMFMPFESCAICRDGEHICHSVTHSRPCVRCWLIGRDDCCFAQQSTWDILFHELLTLTILSTTHPATVADLAHLILLNETVIPRFFTAENPPFHSLSLAHARRALCPYTDGKLKDLATFLHSSGLHQNYYVLAAVIQSRSS
ncbi:hypothetical protein FB451DRAFT_1407953 [Mycena latifolia]|nr:hypothetical protein FB451DRAFT_1407953 [Mycena latifolia]